MTSPLYSGPRITVEQGLDDEIDVTLETDVVEVVIEGQTPAVLEYAYEGPQGPRGLRGEPGEQGRSGGAYQHTQNNATTYWLVQHNLGFRPGGFVVTDDLGADVEPVIAHLNENATLLTFFAPTAGTATVS